MSVLLYVFNGWEATKRRWG